MGYSAELSFCLYVRDYYGIKDDLKPPIPKLLPPVESPDGSDVTYPGLTEEWTSWWHERLDAHQSGRRRQAGESPFDFPELTDYKRLQNLARSVSDEGRQWSGDRKDEFFTAYHEHPELSREIAKMMEKDNSRGDLRLSIVCLPLTGVVGLKMREGLLIISYEMYRSHEVFVRWLGEAINQLVAVGIVVADGPRTRAPPVASSSCGLPFR